MTFRGRIVLACVLAALVPLGLFAYGARREVRERLRMQFEQRVALTGVSIRQQLSQHGTSLDVRLTALASRLAEEPQTRAALLGHVDPTALLDYAADAMPALGFDHLLLVDSAGTVLSSGHFRNEYDRKSTAMRMILEADAPVLLAARRAEGTLLALVRAVEFDVGGRRFAVAGGVEVDSTFVRSLARGADAELVVSLVYPEGTVPTRARNTAGSVVEEFGIRFADDVNAAAATGDAHWVVAHTLAPLHAIQRRIDVWLVVSAAAAVLLALLIAQVLAARVSRPLEDLARRSLRVNLDDPDVTFWSRRPDEVGTLARMLDTMVNRLRDGANELRVAERRATVGDLARQVNHDVRNGLLPIRNVIRHLSEVARDTPADLASTFSERADTLQSGITYLESLAANYARLTPRAERQTCDVNAIVRAAAGHASPLDGTRVRLNLAAGAPGVMADPVALRRVVENLIVNAQESLGQRTDGQGTVTVSTETAGQEPGEKVVTVTVADNGSGIDAADMDRIFDDFYTTRQRGTGLGLSIVRRLVAEMGARIQVESEAGRGTTFRVHLPEAP